MVKPYDIELKKYGRKIPGPNGKSLLEALVGASIFLRSDCGGKGKCGQCRVTRIKESAENETILCCEYKISENISIEIPQSSMLSSHVISKPPLSYPSAFVERMKDHPSLPGKYGVAVDLGTTTIAVYLCDAGRGEMLSSMALKNPQALYGDDVMSRLGKIAEDADNLPSQQKLVVNSVNWAIGELTKAQGLEKQKISEIVAVGNPAMIHILLGINPERLGFSPYRPEFYEARSTDGGHIGLDSGEGRLYTLPQISGFIGGDILAAALAADLAIQPDGTLLIDLGTNGELIIKAGEKFYATSCATGPAFEGASLACGMQALPGAIDRVKIHNVSSYPGFTQISPGKEVKPTGICGSGVISAVAELWRKRLLQQNGAFQEDDTTTPLQRDKRDKLRYIIAKENHLPGSPPVYLSQKDIRAVQLGKAALRTGIDFLTRAAGFKEPEKIIIAGAFGANIEVADMITIGMIPRLARERIESAGNAAGAGAVMVLSDEHYGKKAAEIADRTTTIDLAADPGFQQKFVDMLAFPVLE